MSTKRSGGISPTIAAIILGLLVVAGIGGGFIAVSNAKRTYANIEKDMPESAISNYFQQIKQADFDGIYEDSLVVAPHLNSKEAYIGKLEEIYDGVDTNSIAFTASEDEPNTYFLSVDKKYLATLKLLKADDGRWLASTIFSGNNNYVIEVPTGLKINVNGLDIGEEYMVEEDVVAENFKGMDNPVGAPHVDRYELNNLLSEPTIEVVGKSGYGTLKDVVSGTIYVGETTNDKTLEDTFINDIIICAKYPAQESGLGSVAAVSVTNSDWYNRIRTLQNNWFTSHGTSRFFNEQAFNIIKQSEDSMVGYVTFDYYASNGEVDRTWNSGFQLSFVKQNGVWKIAGMGVDSTLNPAKEIMP